MSARGEAQATVLIIRGAVSSLTEAEQAQAMRGLNSAAGFLQAKVANRLQTRTTPHLTFRRDDGIKKSIELSRLIDEAIADDRGAKKSDASGEDAASPDDATP